MRWLVVLASVVCIVLCQQSDSVTEPAQESKGVVDWINGWFTTPSPSDTPQDCPECHCGIARTRRRIVGGYETVKLEMMWIAVMLYRGRFYCAGSLINDLYVLTAAHCVAGFQKEKMTLRFLEHDRAVPNETTTIDRKVAAIIRHPNYNPGNYDSDIALLRLDKRMDLTTAIKRSRDEELDNVKPSPVCLPTRGLSFSNYSAVVSGWGTTEEGGSVSNILQEVYVPIMSNSECRKTSYKQRITENMLCAGYPDGGKDACQGDSGGPLHVLNTTTNKYQEVGVVSWGEGCARPDKPGVYTRVNRYLTWIMSNTKGACYCK